MCKTAGSFQPRKTVAKRSKANSLGSYYLDLIEMSGSLSGFC